MASWHDMTSSRDLSPLQLQRGAVASDMTTAHVAPEQRDGAKLKRELSFDDQETVLPKKQLIIIFLSLGFALVLAFIDTTSVSTAQSSIADDLQAGASITWVGTSYYVST